LIICVIVTSWGDRMNTGEKIKQAREKAGMTQAELAKKLNVTQAMISAYEKNKRNPKPETIKKIADALQIYPAELGFTMVNPLSKIDINNIDGTTFEAVIGVLRRKFGKIERVNVGKMLDSSYYRVGSGKTKFILQTNDIVTLENATESFILTMTERIKDTRPEKTIVSEILEDLDDSGW